MAIFRTDFFLFLLLFFYHNVLEANCIFVGATIENRYLCLHVIDNSTGQLVKFNAEVVTGDVYHFSINVSENYLTAVLSDYFYVWNINCGNIQLVKKERVDNVVGSPVYYAQDFRRVEKFNLGCQKQKLNREVEDYIYKAVGRLWKEERFFMEKKHIYDWLFGKISNIDDVNQTWFAELFLGLDAEDAEIAFSRVMIHLAKISGNNKIAEFDRSVIAAGIHKLNIKYQEFQRDRP